MRNEEMGKKLNRTEENGGAVCVYVCECVCVWLGVCLVKLIQVVLLVFKLK